MTAYTIPVYLINLDRRPDRLEEILGNLRRIGVPNVTRIRAFDADEVVGRMPDGLSASQAACRESHFLAMNEVLDGNHPAALILEDDAQLSPRILDILSTLDWWPKGTRAVKLDARQKPLLLGAGIGKTPCGSEIRPIVQSAAGAFAYMIDREGAEIVLNSDDDIGMDLDSMLFNMIGSSVARRLNPAQVVPGVALHSLDKGSDISFLSSPRSIRPVTRAWLKAGIGLKRITGQVRRVAVPYRP